VADIGFTGRDIVVEKEVELDIVKEFSFGKCDMVVAVPEEMNIESAKDLPNNLRVATSFPNIAKKYFEKLGKNAKDVLFFDDNLGAISTAKSAGMRVCGVYDDSSKDCVSKMQEIADKYIFDFIELLN
jgi:ATP phosphoribosyltransferase